MAELDTEHVRMLDAGRQRVAYSSPFTSSCFASVASKKTQLLQHGNTFGLSFVATETGFVMTENNELEKSCNDYSKRRQEAMDHGEKLTMDEIHELPVAKKVQLPSIAYWIALSRDELTLAVAYGDSVALFEVAHIKEAAVPAPFHTFSKMQAQEITWCTDSASEQLAVLTLEKQVVVCTLEGERNVIDTQTDAASISWSPSGEQIAVGLVDGSIGIYARKSLEFVRSIAQPESCAEQGLEVHHVNWAEEELIMAGYQKYENEETSALACIFDKDECVELDEVVAFFDVEGRRHQYFSVFLPDWRMFFISCSLSADIELLVSDPDGGEWQLWKPLEKYQARLPMNTEDEESFPMGFTLNLNSTTPVPVEEDAYPPVPIISCANTEGLLVNFSFVDTTVNEVDFVKIPSPFEKNATRATEATSNVIPGVKAEVVETPKKVISHEYGQDAENEFAESDGESSDEEEARKEEEDNARVTFRTMAADGADYIASDLFPKLFKAMGSTYDEDVHASTVASLEKDGKIYEADFVSWYVNWIFGTDDSDSEEEDDAPAPSEAKPAEMKSKEEIAAAFSKFTAKEGSWKCGVCMINNDREAVKCSSCETPNPAAPKVVAPVTTAGATSAGSIGSGGFSFPVSSGDALKTSSFSFGGTPSTDSNAVAATKSTGFSFGGAAATTGFNFPSSSTSGTGFAFPTTSKSSTGFNFEAAAAKTVSDDTSRDKGESNDASSPNGTVEPGNESSSKKAISHEYGQDAENEFAESDGESSDEEEARKEEEDNARVTFRTMAADGADYIASDLFPKLFKAMGSTYDEDVHASTVASLEKDGKIYEADFVSWYVNWIFGTDDSDSEEEDDAPAPSEAKPAEMKSKEEIAAAFSKFTAKEGSWKCGVCMINNDREAVKCSSCETPNPAAPKVVAPVTTAGATSAGSIGSGGFSFPVSSGDALKTSSFSFGGTPSTDSNAVAATKSTGFSFGGAAATTGFNFPSSSTSGTGFAFPTTSKSSTGFNFEAAAAKTVSDDTSRDKGESNDASSPNGTVEPGNESSSKKAISHEYGQDAENEFAESDGESSDEEEARKEEEDNARVTFRTMAADGADYIASDLFPKLFKAMGSTYDEDVHASTVASLEKDGKIYEADFVSWYVNWIFGTDDSDSEEEDDAPAPSEAKPAEMKSKEEIAAAFSKFTAKEGSWKCGVCMINNDREAVKCSSCETPNPAAPKVVAPVTTAGATSAGSIGSGGFSFPVSSGDALKTSSFSFGGTPSTDSNAVAATKSTGFSFGGAAATTGFNFPSSSTSGTGFAFPTTSKSSTGFNFEAAAAKTTDSSAYPPDTTSKPKPPSFGAASGGYPPDTTSKPKPPSFGAASGGYPPDTTSKPKPPSFGAASGGYPPDTTSKPKPPSFGAASGGYPPDTTSKPKPPSFGAASGGYPPDTTSKPKPPSFGAASGGYPPDTTSKPKPPSFGAASGGYPPDTTSKPTPPSFGAASGGYPPDTTSKPKPPSFGAASGGYPPDTTSKPKPPSFGAASGGYPPDTTSKPKPPSFGAASGGYPPDTTSKPKPPSFGAASGGYPPDTTSKPKPPVFGQSTNQTASSSSSSFGSFGKSMFGSNQASSTTTDSSTTKSNSFFGNGFGSNGTTDKPADTSSSPFGVVPSAKSKSAFSTSATAPKEDAPKTTSARPSFSFDNVSATLENTDTRDSSDEQPRTKRTLNFGDASRSAAKTNSVPSTMAKAKPMPAAAPADPSKGIPSSRMEGQLWKLIVDFHKSLERVNARSKTITSKDGEFSKKLLAQMETIRARISSLCDEINSLDESRDQIEKDVLFVIGIDGDVHEQLEYGREILSSFKDEALKRTLEEQPLDQRSKETWESLKDKLAEVEKSCVELDSHLSSSKIGVDGAGAVSSAHLFHVLKQTYDNSKMQYNNACKLAEFLEKLSLRGDHLRESNGVNGISGVEVEAHPLTTKADMVQMIVETEQRSQYVRLNFLSLCNNVVTPRDVFSTPRRKLAPPVPSNSSNSPLRVKACSKLMPKTQLSVASPMSSAKQSSRSVSFKDTPVKSGSKLFSLAEAMAPKEEPTKLVKTPQPTPLSVGVGKAPQRPSLGAPAAENKSASTNPATSSISNVFSLPKPGMETTSTFGGPAKEEKTTSSTTSFGGFGVNSPPVKSKRKADGDSAPAFSLGGKEPPAASSAFSFGSKNAAQSPSSTFVTKDYKALLENFYKVHNPSKTGSVLDKVLTTYKGREEDLFTRIFTMYVPDSTPEDIKKYLSGGPVPPKSETVAAASKSPAPANTAAKSLFGGFGASTTTPKDTATKPSPFGASPSAFSLGAANTSSGFSGFGSSSSTTQPSTMTPTAFGQPAVDYRQKLVEFYQKHNPDKLSSVDTTLQKYKGNEEKLFQNLAVKYKLNGATGGVPASPAVQPSKPNAAASPFGKAGAFSAPSTSTGAAFGSTSSVGFGASKPAPSASPFGAPASSPFGTTTQSSSGFGSSGGSGFGGGFQSTAATTPAFGAPTPFGAAAGGFGASAGGVNYREKLTAFYQQHNPTKLSSVDATLEKYKGREDHLFAMLEQKYVKKTPTAPAAGGFGIPSISTFGGGSGFGAPAALGSAGAAPAFGSASTLGGAAQPAFGGAAGSGFGMASQMGGGFGSAIPAATSGGAPGSGFSSFGSQNPSFGGAAQQTGGFGAPANTGGFGSGFGGTAASGGFGQPTAFSSSSFTQMR